MKQLGIIDSAFINLENPTVPQHVGGLGIYDPSTAAGGLVRFKDVLANFEQRLQRLPIFRTRLVEVPFGLDRPYWVQDPNFDVEFHIRHIALPQPGDWRQLCIQIARLHSRPIDMSRPLWEVYIIEGLDNIPELPKGAFAVYTKMHHSLVDGAGGQSFMAALHDATALPRHKAAAGEEAPLIGELQPTDVRLLGETALKALPRSFAAAKGAAATSAALVSMAMRMMRKELPPAQMSGPKTRFDQPVGHNRVFEAQLFDLEQFKALKNAAGCTLDDIAVAIIAGALRKYLEAHNELPAQSLLASMSVNMRTRVGETGDNNQGGAISASLHTDIADPVERIRVLKKSLDEAEAYIDTPLVSIMKLPGILPPLLAKPLARLYVRNKLTRYLPIGQATVITNVPGPHNAMYCAGAKLVCYYPLGVINAGLGLFHALFSCSGKISITVTADRGHMPDPEFYRQCLDASWEEMRHALLGKQRSTHTRNTRRRPASTPGARSKKRSPSTG